MSLLDTVKIAGAGMRAQGERTRIVSENLANASATAREAGGDPYRRKTISFETELDRALGLDLIKTRKIGLDRSEFEQRFDPGHPSAGADGYVKLPNVNPLIEMMDLREAQRSYEANLGVIETAKAMIQRTLDLLRA